MKSSAWKKGITALMLILCLVLILFLLKAYFDGKFDSVHTLQDYIAGFGIFAPLILTMIQALQVVIPVLPGFLGCAAGAVLFGSIKGFLCNYIGISAGSIIAFFLARRYGVSIVKNIFSKENYEKWSSWIADKKSYNAVLFLVTLLPLFPDDFFCYFSGLTKMRASTFIWIIVLGKPWCILLYSLFFKAAA
ncbi:MAG: TVP38/TMEM64 family protein [Firmicutes bacterium]|nr:TVP38/TMEM64 family protein [Bacillota bacterium]